MIKWSLNNVQDVSAMLVLIAGSGSGMPSQSSRTLKGCTHRAMILCDGAQWAHLFSMDFNDFLNIYLIL